jgi:hypothetical protein
VSAHLHISVLHRYADPRGRRREILTRAGRAGSLLVIDRDAASGEDCRLVAHLAADEPRVNAALTCRDYLRNPNRWCRPLVPADLQRAPVAEDPIEDSIRDLIEDPSEGPLGAAGGESSKLRDRRGHLYRLAPLPRGRSIPELRWQRLPADGSPDSASAPARMRDVIGALETYRPIRALTAGALARHDDDPDISTSKLRGELERLLCSHIVLNRGLREAVLAAVDEQGLTLSEITFRCGHFKRDVRGNCHGDTSWLSRRIGLVAENGKSEPTPWVHSDVLAQIARDGLGISPREVELG